MQSRKFLRVAVPIIIISLLLSIAAPVLFSSAESATVSGEGDEEIYYFLNDHLGSVDVVLDDYGNVVERRDYLPYGPQRAVESFNGVPITELGFTGKHLDDETGLNYYGARYYDPVAGRFIQGDPFPMNINKMSQAERNAFLSNPQNLNMYSYVRNNPVNYTDPTGMYMKDVHYDLTLHLGLMAGLTDGQAETVAYRDQYMDENPETTPFSLTHPIASYDNLKTGVTEYYHFATRDEAIARLNDALDDSSSSTFGDSLHTFQDTFSHEGLTPEEHKDSGKDPDRTYLDQTKARNMAKQSFLYLRKLQRITNGLGGLTAAEYRRETAGIWNSNKDEISEYLWAKDKTGTTIETNARVSEEED